MLRQQKYPKFFSTSGLNYLSSVNDKGTIQKTNTQIN